MNIELGADIVGSNGDKIGVVDGLVMDPHTGEARSMVLRKGLFFPTDLIIPLEAVTSASPEQVNVNFTKDDANTMTEYMDADYMTPPAGYFPSNGVFYWPAATVYARDHVGNLVAEDEVHERDPDSILVTEGTLVVDVHGENLGRIVELESDAGGRVSAFKVEQGFFRRHERHIPAHLIKAADDNVVELSIGKDDLERMHDRLIEQR